MMETPDSAQHAEARSANESHVLLTALGVRAEPTLYRWGQQEETAPLTPLALLQMLSREQRPNRAIAMVTARAREETWPLFEEQIRAILGSEAEPIHIPDGRSADELREILESVAERIPPGSKLTLDVTQGLRHFPFVVYALVLYLTSLRGVRLEGAYYGMLEGIPREQPHPIVDLRLLLELPEWFHAVRVFRDQGIAAPIAKLIEPAVQRLRENARRAGNDPSLHRQASQLATLADKLQQYSFACATGLPLELGKSGRMVADTIPEVARSEPGRSLPLVSSLAKIVAQAAENAAFCNTPPGKGDWKKSIELNAQELERQARLIDAYLERGQVAVAT